MQRCRRKLCVLLLCAMLMSLLATQALAAPLEDSGTLTIQSQYGTEKPVPVPGMKYSLYRIADIDEGSKITLTETFKDYPVKLEGETAADWDGIAQVLSGYVRKDGIEASYVAPSGEDGTVKFDVERGLYLVIGQSVTVGGYVYKVSPCIVCVPNIVDGKWNYDVTMLPKLDRDAVPPPPPSPPEKETVDRKVLKVWNDQGFEEDRPEFITVYLMRDDEVYDTVKLNEENGWSYSWRELDALNAEGTAYEWTVVEEPVENYTVTVEIKGVTYVLVNERWSDIPDEPPPEGEPPEEELPDEPVPLGNLPQTGVTWWPVPILLCLGILFLTAGAIRRRRNEA